MTEFYVFLPQMRMSLDVMLERARAAEAAGFLGLAMMDHLAPPLALDQPMYEAMTTAAVLLAGTTTLKVGHLVLCDAFRQPTMLAREAVTLDHFSGGRFELGIGSGSVPEEFTTYGITPTSAKARTDRLTESLEVITRLWSGETFDFDGAYHRLEKASQAPTPLGTIPIVIGGAGPRTVALVAKYADVWNVPIHRIDRFEEMRPQAGEAKVSIQQRVTFIQDEAERAKTVEVVTRRFGKAGSGHLVGNADELVAAYSDLAERGVERFYTWFTDFAVPSTLTAFGEQVIARMG